MRTYLEFNFSFLDKWVRNLPNKAGFFPTEKLCAGNFVKKPHPGNFINRGFYRPVYDFAMQNYRPARIIILLRSKFN